MLFVLLLLVGSAIGQECEPGWSYFNGNCYKHIVDFENRMGRGSAWEQCAFRNAHLTSIESPEEMNFVVSLASRPGSWVSKVDAMEQNVDPSLVVGYQKGNKQLNDYVSVGGFLFNQWVWPHSTSTWYKWCNNSGQPAEPTRQTDEYCVIMQIDQPCLYDALCSGDYGNRSGYARYVCKKSSR